MNKCKFAHRHDDYGEDHALMASLWDKPLNLADLKDNYLSIVRRLGFYDQFLFGKPEKQNEFDTHLKERLLLLERRGWIDREDQRYILSDEGRKITEKFIQDLRKVGKFISALYNPKTVSIVSLITHFVLALIKLPAGIISGSVGLMNDAIDTLLDGISCILVFMGIHFKREGLVNFILVVIMLLTGGYTLFEGIDRFIHPVSHSFNFFTFFAAVFSAILCLLLYFYQRIIGLKSGNVSLITQSIDSRNHVIVATGVIIGLISSLLNFKILDTLVGLVIAVIILKSALELLIEIIKSRSEQNVDLSKYKLFLEGSYENIRKKQMKNWMLYLVDKQKVISKQELLGKVRKSLDFGQNAVLREIGLGKSSWHQDLIESLFEQLVLERLLINGENIKITPEGHDYIKKKLRS
jgi:Co/Zn/Cd efflux system component